MKNIRELLIVAALCLSYGISFAAIPKINVTVKDQSGNPVPGAEIICAKIDPMSATGDPSEIQFGTADNNGNKVFNVAPNFDFIVFISKNGYEPSFFQQMNNPGIQPVRVRYDSDNINLNITIWQLPAGVNVGQLKFDVINISSATLVQPTTTTIVVDIRNKDTDAPVAFGFSQVNVWTSSVTATIYANNVPVASSATYRAYCGVVQQVNKMGMESVIYQPVIKGGVADWVFDFSMAGFVSNVQQTQSQQTSQQGAGGQAAFVGVVTSTDNIPLSGAMVELQMHNDSFPANDFRDSRRVGQTFTDNGGSFAFYNVQPGAYAVSANKEGYLGQWSQNQNPPANGTGYAYSGAQTVNIQPLQLQKGYGKIRGRVLVWDRQKSGADKSAPVPNAYVNVNGMWDNWAIILGDAYDNYYTTGPGRGGNGWGHVLTSADGTFELSGLGSGNFTLDVWSELSNGQYRFGDGPNQQYNNSDPDGGGPQPNVRSNDDLRIQVSSAPRGSTDLLPSTLVFSSAAYMMTNYAPGTAFNQNIDIYISTLPARTGAISGTITFKDYGSRTTITSDDPIMLMAWEDTSNSSNWASKKIYNWTYSTGPIQTTDYTLYVSTGVSYYVQFKSKSWAILNQQDMRCDLVINNTISSKDMTLVPAGSIKVVVKDQYGNIVKRTAGGQQPEGDIYTDGTIIVNGPTNWGEGLSEQGETYLYGLVPGTYKVRVNLSKYKRSFGSTTPNYLPPEYPELVMENVIVSVGKQTTVEAKLKPGAIVIPGGSASALPPLAAGTKGFYSVGGWEHGETLTASKLSAALFSSTGDNSMSPEGMSVGFRYNQNSGIWESKGSQGNSQGTRISDAKVDFFLGYVNIFKSEPPNQYNDMPINFHQSFTVLTTKMNDEIKYDPLNPNVTHFIQFGSGDSGTGTLGVCTIKGSFRMKNTFSRDVVEKMLNGGGMQQFVKYIPTLMLYDNQGNFKGFSNAMPTAARIGAWDAYFKSNPSVNSAMEFFTAESQYPLEYWCEKLPAGDYTLVVGHPNYPPMMKRVTLVSGVNTFDIDVDEAKVAGYSLSGVVKSTDGVVIMGANVVIKNKNANIEKKAQTDSSGAFAVYGLAPGIYRIDVSRGGYAIGGKKVSISKENATVEVLLRYSDGSISGTVFTQRMPAKVLPEAKIIAYDETENGLAATKYLPSYKVITDNNGQFFIPDIISGHVYKIYCVAEGKYLEYRELTPAAGENTGVDFTLKPSKPRLRISSKKSLVNNQILYNFLIECPNRLINPANPSAVGAPYCRYSPAATVNSAFDETKAVEVLVVPGTNNTYEIAFNPGAGSNYYKMRILATDGANEFYEDILFGPNLEARAKKDMAGEIAEGGQIEIDSTGYDTTKVGLDPGSVTPASVTQTTVKTGAAEVPVGGFLSALPNFQLSKTGNAKSDAMEKLVKSIVASDVYEINLDGAQLNKSLTLTFNYSRDSVGEDEMNQMQVGRYNTATGKWEIVPGIVTADPLTSTVSLDVESIGGSNDNPAPKAEWDGRRFSINRAAATTQSGVYAVFLQDPNTVKKYAGTDFTVFNFPNPFDLKSKSVDTQDDYSTDQHAITGTMVKYALPSKYNGAIKFYVYNIAGEMVRELDLGTKEGGYYYYAEWDGRNDSGEDCASGVYLMLAMCDGKKINDKPLKMAIIK